MTLLRFELDKTGANPNNAITGETHTLNLTRVRAVAPRYGAFFTQSVQIYDQASGELLTPGIQYRFADTLTVSGLYNREICWLILIIDQNVSNTVSINYQVLGGDYTNNSSAISRLYEQYLNDDRPVDFANIINPPSQWPMATKHPHPLTDVYNFGPLVAAIERLRMAVLLSHAPELDRLVKWVEDLVGDLDYATVDDLQSGIPSNKVITAETLMYCCYHAKEHKYFELKPLEFSKETLIHLIGLRIENYPPGTLFYWTIEDGNTQPLEFTQREGQFTYQGHPINLPIQFTQLPEQLNPYYKLVIRTSPTGLPIVFNNQWLYPYQSPEPMDTTLLTMCEYDLDPLSITGSYRRMVLKTPFYTY